MITIRNQNIQAVAASQAHPTTERAIEQFVRSLPLSQIADVCPVENDLYDTNVLVFDRDGLARAWVRAGMGREFAEQGAWCRLVVVSVKTSGLLEWMKHVCSCSVPKGSSWKWLGGMRLVCCHPLHPLWVLAFWCRRRFGKHKLPAPC